MKNARILFSLVVMLQCRLLAIEPQPFLSSVRSLMESADYLGCPFSTEESATLRKCIEAQDAAAVERAQEVLDSHALFVVAISPEQRVKVVQGKAKPQLNEAGWSQFLVKVGNEAGTTAPLRITSGEAKQVFDGGAVRPRKGEELGPNDPPIAARWLDLQTWDSPPLRPALSGLGVEYRILGLYSRDAGPREARFHFDVGQGTQDLGYRGEANVLFDCRAAREIIVVADSSKFGRVCLHKILEPKGISKLVTDEGIGAATRAELERIGIEVLIA